MKSGYIPLCNAQDRYVSDVAAVTDIQLSQFARWETFSQALDPDVTHSEIHTMSWKSTQI